LKRSFRHYCHFENHRKILQFSQTKRFLSILAVLLQKLFRSSRSNLLNQKLFLVSYANDPVSESAVLYASDSSDSFDSVFESIAKSTEIVTEDQEPQSFPVAFAVFSFVIANQFVDDNFSKVFIIFSVNFRNSFIFVIFAPPWFAGGDGGSIDYSPLIFDPGGVTGLLSVAIVHGATIIFFQISFRITFSASRLQIRNHFLMFGSQNRFLFLELFFRTVLQNRVLEKAFFGSVSFWIVMLVFAESSFCLKCVLKKRVCRKLYLIEKALLQQAVLMTKAHSKIASLDKLFFMFYRIDFLDKLSLVEITFEEGSFSFQFSEISVSQQLKLIMFECV